MSHYPSTAELAAFRRAVPRLAPFPSAPVHRNGNDGAYSWQRTKGIGYLETAPDAMCIVIPDGAVHTGVIARRRAGVLRSRAYEASRCPVCSHANLPDSEGCVCYTGDPWLSCDICDGREWSGDLTPDWNGETGCHLSCEPAYV